MGVWTVCTALAYLRQVRRMALVVLADVVITCGLMLTSKLILSADQFVNSVPLITTVWAAPTPVAAGLLAGRTTGAGVGLLVTAVTAMSRAEVDTDVIRDGVLLIGSGFLIGLAASTARASAARLERALRAEAANAERERLARSIHDSVLQVLARVRKRGTELGGQAAELAALAGDQEIALRALIGSAPEHEDANGDIDLRTRLQLLASSTVEVSLPATRVALPKHVAEELHATVVEALANVAEHAGNNARAWVLLEDLGSSVVLSVRDDGVGIPDGRLAAAQREGRLGVAQSMRARVAALGGSLDLRTAPGEGTEWEIQLTRPAARKPRRGWSGTRG